MLSHSRSAGLENVVEGLLEEGEKPPPKASRPMLSASHGNRPWHLGQAKPDMKVRLLPRR